MKALIFLLEALFALLIVVGVGAAIQLLLFVFGARII